MRTKSTILGAAILAAGVASSMASNVYSVNVVGYVTVPITNGFSMIANPLDYDGSGTNNTLNSALPGLPDGTTIYKFSSGTFNTVCYSYGGAWYPNATLNPGEGCFIQSSTNTSATFVGTVLTNTSFSIPSGFSIIGSQVPITGGAATALNLTNMTDNDTIYTWSTAGQTYNGANFAYGGAWYPEPTITPGQAFFISAQSPKTWAQHFSIQ